MSCKKHLLSETFKKVYYLKQHSNPADLNFYKNIRVNFNKNYNLCIYVCIASLTQSAKYNIKES